MRSYLCEECLEKEKTLGRKGGGEDGMKACAHHTGDIGCSAVSVESYVYYLLVLAVRLCT